MSSRATPFGLFSAVSYLPITEANQLLVGEIEFDATENQYFIDSAIPCIQERLLSSGELKVVLSQHCSVRGDNVHFLNRNLRNGEALGVVTKSPLIEALLAAAQTLKPIYLLADDIHIIADIQYPGRYDVAHILSLIKHWLDVGLLTSDLAPSLYERRPYEFVHDKLISDYGLGASDAAYEDLQSLVRELHDPGPLRLADFQAQGKSLRADAVFRAPEASVSKHTISAALDVVGKVVSANFHVDPAYLSVKQLLASEFGEAFVPLALLCDQRTRVGSMLASISQGEATEHSVLQSRTVGANIIDGLILQSNTTQGIDQIDLSKSSEIAEHIEKAVVSPFSGCTMLIPKSQMGEISNSTYWITGAVSGCGLEMMGRFTHLLPQVKKGADLLSELHASAGRLPVELLYGIEVNRRDVTQRDRLFERYISLDRPYKDNNNAVSLDELYIRLVGGSLEIYSSKIDSYLYLAHTSALNWRGSFGRNLLYWLLNLVNAGTNLWYNPSTEVKALPYAPRVNWGPFTISLAQWRLPLLLLDRLQNSPQDKGIDLFLDFHDRNKMPRWLEVGEVDQFAQIDTKSRDSVAAHWKVIRERTTVIRECYATHDDAVCRDAQGQAHQCELVVPFRTMTAPPPAPPLTNTRGRIDASVNALKTSHTFLPGSIWTQLHIFCPPALADDVFERTIVPLCGSELNNGAIGWFFIKYGYPRLHFRVRIKYPNAKLAGERLPEIGLFFSKLPSSGILQWCFTPYEQECLRYGGLEAVECCEAIFCADTAYAMAARAGARRLSVVDREDWFCLAYANLIVSLGESLDQLGVDWFQTLQALHNLYKSAPRGEAKSKSGRASIQTIVRALTVGRSKTVDDLELKLILAAGRRWQRTCQPHIERIVTLNQEGRLTVGLEGLLASIVHMMANRVFPTWSKAREIQGVEISAKYAHAKVYLETSTGRSRNSEAGVVDA
jgi:thiopeptide-type bacteriocin biosynthesis protein